jgi:hypothetical protein
MVNDDVASLVFSPVVPVRPTAVTAAVLERDEDVCHTGGLRELD